MDRTAKRHCCEARISLFSAVCSWLLIETLLVLLVANALVWFVVGQQVDPARMSKGALLQSEETVNKNKNTRANGQSSDRRGDGYVT